MFQYHNQQGVTGHCTNRKVIYVLHGYNKSGKPTAETISAAQTCVDRIVNILRVGWNHQIVM